MNTYIGDPPLSPPEPTRAEYAAQDFLTDHSDNPELWAELFCNMSRDAQITHMRLLNTKAPTARERMNDAARDYLNELIDKRGLEYAREVWG